MQTANYIKTALLLGLLTGLVMACGYAADATGAMMSR
jgi:hypothetical protein